MVVDLGFRDSWDRVFKALEAQADWPALARRLGQDVRANADRPAQVRAAWQRVGLLSRLAAETGVVIDRDAMGRELGAVFDAALESLRFLRDWVREAQAHGEIVEGAAELHAMIAELEAMRAEALDNWPWTPTKEEWDEGVADFERGDSLPADEAFAEIAGMDKDAWLRRVEEYRRRPRRGRGRMSFTVRLRPSVRRKIARWNLAGDLVPEVYLRLTEDLARNPSGLLQRVTHPFDGLAYIFPAVERSNRVYGYVFTFHVRYGADEETLWVVTGGYERVPV